MSSTLSKMAAATLALASVFSLAGCGKGLIDYSDGKRVGVVTKFSHKGVFCKTWEGQLAMSNFKGSSDGSTSNSFDFSVVDPNMVKPVDDALESQKLVELTYHQVLLSGPCTQDTQYQITGVKPSNASPIVPALGK